MKPPETHNRRASLDNDAEFVTVSVMPVVKNQSLHSEFKLKAVNLSSSQNISVLKEIIKVQPLTITSHCNDHVQHAWIRYKARNNHA